MIASLILVSTLALAAPEDKGRSVERFDPATNETSEPVSETPPGTVPPAHPARARWAIDGIITGTAAITWGVLEYGVTDQLEVPTPPAPGRPASVGGLDAVAIGHFRPGAAIASDVLIGVGLAAPIVIHGLEAGLRRDRVGLRFGTDLLLISEAVAINMLVTETLKFAVRRPRPLLYTDPDAIDPDNAEELREQQAEADAYKSFPSGHASLAFSAAVSSSTLLTLKWRKGTRKQKIGLGLVWGFSVALAGTTAALRVAAGKHYPSDVIVGSVLGSGIGALVPLVHARPDREGRSVALAPALSRSHRGVSLSAAF